VLVGQTTYLLTSAQVAYARRRRVRAKGFDSSLDAFGVEDLNPRSARRTIPFVGRASEQAILGQSLGSASTSGRPVLATVVGRPSAWPCCSARGRIATRPRSCPRFTPDSSR